MIHSVAFDALPPDAKRAVYDRMWMALGGETAEGRYSHLTADDRRAIVEILRDTKFDLPNSWRPDFTGTVPQ